MGWFVLGFFFYASLFAVAGSIVTRQEDLQTTMTPLTILILGSFFIGLSATATRTRRWRSSRRSYRSPPPS